MRFADLHVHSHFSDGTFSPARLVQEAKEKGLGCISVTDHDTTDAVDPAIAEGGADVEVLPGIELTAEANSQEVHILGYLIDHRDKDLLAMLARMQEARQKRIFAICEKLNALGLPLEPEDVFRVAGFGSVGRLHVARAMVMKGYCATTGEAFFRFIGDKGPAYAGKFKMTPKEAVDWILRVRGIPVLAHPHTLGDPGLIPGFVKDGIMGLEAYYPEHSSSQTRQFTQIAGKYGLLITGGSDCHGAAKSEMGMGKVKLPYEYVEKLKEAQCRLRL